MKKSRFDFYDENAIQSAFDDMIEDMQKSLVKKSKEINGHDDRNG